MCNSFNKSVFPLIGSLTALIIVSGMLLCACDTAAAGTSSQETCAQTAETMPVTAASEETVISTESSMTEETSAATKAVNVTEIEESEAETSEAPAEVSETEIGYGPYGFQRGNVRFHSQNDISMMIGAEDPTIYDYGARDQFCSWIDIFYVEESFDMTAFDYSYRFLSFYNDDTSLTFSEFRDIGTWQTPKGSELQLCLAGITIISDNLEIKILPKTPSEPGKYNVSVNGRGYYVSEEQLQMADFVLSYLAENPGTDPLEGLVSGVDHTYYF